MHPSLGQVPDEPGVDVAEQQFAILGAAAGVRNMIQNPADLAAGKVGIDDEAGLSRNLRRLARSSQV